MPATTRSRVYINPYPIGETQAHNINYEYNYDGDEYDDEEAEDSLARIGPIDIDAEENFGRMRRLDSNTTSGLIADEQERVDNEELNELEQYELDDRLGEMMSFTFGRRTRRVRFKKFLMTF